MCVGSDCILVSIWFFFNPWLSHTLLYAGFTSLFTQSGLIDLITQSGLIVLNTHNNHI